MQEVMSMPTFTNQATLSYNNITVNSNIVSGEIAESLLVEKTALSDTYGLKDKITYAVSIRNTSNSSYTYSISDDLGAYTFNGLNLVPLAYVEGSIQLFINGVLQPAPIVSTGAPLEAGNIVIPAGGNAVILYTVETNEFTPYELGNSVINTVDVDTDGPCSGSAQATVTPAEEPSLTISKSLSPCQLDNCTQPLSYTFTISNFGPVAATAADNAVITDTFDPPLNITSVIFNGEEWTEGVNYTYDEETGEFATIPGEITVPAATYSQDPDTGEWIAAPGVSTLVVNGNF